MYMFVLTVVILVVCICIGVCTAIFVYSYLYVCIDICGCVVMFSVFNYGWMWFCNSCCIDLVVLAYGCFPMYILASLWCHIFSYISMHICTYVHIRVLFLRCWPWSLEFPLRWPCSLCRPSFWRRPGLGRARKHKIRTESSPSIGVQSAPQELWQ